jgi:hypothetical protein
MSIITEHGRPPHAPWGRRLLWFGGLYAAGVLVTVAVAYVLRSILL